MPEQVNLKLGSETIKELRTLAEQGGAQLGDLADLFIRKGLASMSVEAVAKWAGSRPSRLGRYAGGLTKAEKEVISALERLHQGAAGTPVCWFSLADVAQLTSLRLAVTWSTLQALKGRGLTSVIILDPDKVDRWGRPERSTWALNDRLPDHLKPKHG